MEERIDFEERIDGFPAGTQGGTRPHARHYPVAGKVLSSRQASRVRKRSHGTHHNGASEASPDAAVAFSSA